MKFDVIVSSDQKIISIDELKEKGLSLYRINQFVDQGLLKKMNKKFYENTGYTGEESDFYYAYAYVSSGVICLMSAATYYNLTTFRPDSVEVAIERKARVSTLPEWPKVKLYYYTDERFELGIDTVNEGKNQFRIYDVEKTVVDIVFYRERIGIEETKEILVNYLAREDRNLNRLMRYAELMKCGDIMKNYMEVLV